MTRTRLTAALLACLAACTGKDPATTTDSSSSSSASVSSTQSASSTPTTGESSSTTDAPTSTSTTDPDTTSTSTSTGDPGTSTGGAVSITTGTSTDTDTGTDTSDDTGQPGECLVNSDCATSACLEFRDHDPQATCVDGPPGGNTRFPGTLLDFVTGAPLPSTDVKIVGVLSALTDPENAPAVLAGTSDPAGIIDLTSDAPVQEGIGVVAVVSGGPLFLTCTGVAAPTAGVYGPMSGIHDIWGVPAATLGQWSDLLAQEPALAPDLPLGTKGGTLGLVRDDAGQPVAGATLQSQNPNTNAEIRYLSADKTSFNADATASNGVFIILGAGLAERFEVADAPTATATAGSAEGAIFVVTLDLP